MSDHAETTAEHRALRSSNVADPESGDASTDPLAEVADEFIERYRRGERPPVTEYTQRFPELAERIREVLPMLVMMEQAGEGSGGSRSGDGERPGTALQQVGDYRLLREIGRGGMGIVYEAEQLSLGRRVAVKVLPQHIADDARLMSRFRREARAAARLHHSNIVPVHEIGQEGQLCYYTMQLIAGQSLDEVLRELRQSREQDSRSTKPQEATSGPDIRTALVAESLLTGRVEAPREEPAARTELGATIIQKESGDSSSQSFELRTPDASSKSTVRLGREETDASSAVLPGQLESGSIDFSRRHYYRSVALIGVQVADALAHAHREGILHRDIKPSNLLLDAHGRVWITDFGLAKTEDDDLTKTGDVLGTLRYMPPERFRGWSDPRSDIYSLGVTLYEMVALRPPFDEPDRLKLIHEIANGTPPRLRWFDPQVPADLETVIFKAIDRTPDLRYRTADDLRDDLQRFLDDKPITARRASRREQFWRWCRRNPAVAMLAGTIALLLVAVAVASTIAAWHFRQIAQQREDARGLAVQRESEAQRNFRMAREAVDRYLMQVSDDPRLKSFGLEKLRRELLQTAHEFYAQLVEYAGSDPDLQSDQGQAFRSLAAITAELGSVDEAISLYRRSEEILRRLSQEHPEVPEYRRGLASARNDLGNMLRNTERNAEAEAAYDEAFALRQQLVQEHPDEPAYLHDLFQIQTNLGIVYLETGRREQAEALYQEALQLVEQLTRSDEENPEYRRSLGKIQNNFGVLYRGAGEYEAAETALRTAIDIHRELAAAHPNDPGYRVELALSLTNLGHVLRALQRDDAAETAFKEAAELRQRLAETHPDVPHYQVDAAYTLCNLGSLYRGRGRHEEAERAYSGLVELQERLARMRPDMPAHRRQLSSHLTTLGNLYVDLEQYERAEETLLAVLPMREQLAQEFPNDIYYQIQLGGAYSNIGRCVRISGRAEESLVWYDRAIPVLQAAYARAPSHPTGAEFLVNTLWGRAATYYRLQREEGLADYRGAIAVAQRMAQARPGEAQWPEKLQSLFFNLGMSCEELKRHQEADEAFQACRETLEQLTRAYPHVTEHKVELGKKCRHIGRYLRLRGHAEDALDWQAMAIETLEPVHQRSPENADARKYLRYAYYERARAYDALREKEKAAAARERAKSL